MQPHHHGRKSHLALHTVLPDSIDDPSWEVDVEVTEEDDAVRVLGAEVGGSAGHRLRPGGWGTVQDSPQALSHLSD